MCSNKMTEKELNEALKDLYDDTANATWDKALWNTISGNTDLKPLINTDIIHTNKSKTKMNMYNLSDQDVVDVINKNTKILQNETIFCEGEVCIRLVKKDDKYLVIDVYKK